MDHDEAKKQRMNDPAMVAIRKQKEEEEKEYERLTKNNAMGMTENTDIEADELHLNLEMGVPTAPITSLCINCEDQGETKFMMTKIPFFKEIMISAFCCDHCGFKNSEVSFAGKLEDYGCRYEVNVINDVAFNRQIVKSEFATIRVPEAGLEMPPATQKGSIKTMEGYFMTTIEGLQEVQEQRRLIDPATAQKIDEYCDTLREFAEGKKFPFKFIVEDPSGNSYVQNPSAPTADQYCKKTHWIRTVEDYAVMGYPADQASVEAHNDKLRLQEADQPKKQYQDYISPAQATKSQTKEQQEELLAKVTTYSKRIDKKAVAEAGFVDFSKSVEDQDVRNELSDDDPRKHVSKFPVPCYNCDKQGDVQMCFSSIPFFKEIVLMCFSCDFCGYRNSEIKEGGGMGEKGKKITLQVNEPIDLNRDIFKSNTASFVIPEIGFDMEAGTLGSCFTTVEGLLMKAHEELEKNNPFGGGDSKTDKKFLEFLAKLKKCQDGEMPCTLILDDPADNCFVYNPFAPKDDPKLKIEMYERTQEQNDDLGISDMQTDPEEYTKNNAKERTYIMIKPDGVQRGQVGKIISRFEAKGLKLAAMKLCQPGKEMFEKHYADLSGKGFFKGLVEYAASGPVCCMVWEGDDAVKTGRKMLGATKPFDSNPSTNRGDFCIDVGRNAIHGSDSVESARAEIGLWFKPEELVTWKGHSHNWVYE